MEHAGLKINHDQGFEDFIKIEKPVEFSDIPNEVLYKIFSYLQEHKDVSNWRVLAKRFNEIGEDSLKKLPDEIWDKIFNYLETPADIAHVKQASATFNRLYNEIVPERLMPEDQFELKTLSYDPFYWEPLKKSGGKNKKIVDVTIGESKAHTYMLKDNLGIEYEVPVPEVIKGNNSLFSKSNLTHPPIFYKDNVIVSYTDYSNNSFINIYNVSEGNKCELKNQLIIHPDTKILYSQNKVLTCEYSSKKVQVYDLENLEKISEIDMSQYGNDDLIDIQFKEGKIFWTLRSKNKIGVFDSTNGNMICALDMSEKTKISEPSNNAFKDGYYAQVSWDGNRHSKQSHFLTVWDTTTGKVVFEKYLSNTSPFGKFVIELNLSSRNKQEFIIRATQICNGDAPVSENLLTFIAPKEQKQRCVVQ